MVPRTLNEILTEEFVEGEFERGDEKKFAFFLSLVVKLMSFFIPKEFLENVQSSC